MVAVGITDYFVSPFGISLLGVVIIALLLYLKFSYFPFQVFRNTGIKGPPPSFFFGSIQVLIKLGYSEFFKQLHEKYGRIAGFYSGIHPRVSVTDTELIKLITVKDFDYFINRRKRPDFFGRKADETKGLSEDRDEMWRVGRQTLSPTFSTAKIKAMTPLIHDSVKTLVEIFREQSLSDKSFKIMESYRRFTMETIFATAFGRVIDIQRNESDKLVEAGASMFGSFRDDIRKGRNYFLYYFLILTNLPWLEPVMQFMSRRSSPVKAFKIFNDTATQLIKQRRAETDTGKYKDLLQLMIDATVDEGEGSQKTGKKKLTDKEITAHATLFMLAGYETTSNSLTFTSYLLAIHPDIQEKLQEEIDSYFEENPEASLYEAAQDIGYLDMVIQESLRVYPLAVAIERECGKDYTYKDITIPKGTTVSFPVTLLHKDPEYWEDPEKFDPMRFTPDEKAKRPQQCYLPFGAGPRSCIGMRFALLELKIALMELLKEFTFVRAPDTVVPLEMVLGVPKTPIYLKVATRK